MDPQEEAQLRSVTRQNAQSILSARHKAERELIEAKDALEQKTIALDNSLAVLKAAFEATTDGFIVTDLNQVITAHNRRFLEIWQLGDRSLDGLTHQEFFALVAFQSKEPGPHWARIQEIYDDGPAQTYDVLELADGRTIERYSRIQEVHSDELGRVWSFRDVSESRRAQEGLTRLAAIIESSDDAIVSKRVDGTILTWNAAAERIFGYEPSEIIGKSILTIIPKELESDEQTIIGKIKSGERVDHYETVRVHKDGHLIPVSLTVSPLRDVEGKIVGASKIARDISKQKAAEEALREETRILEILNETGKAISENLDLSALLQTVTDSATRIANAAYGAFFYNTVEDKSESYVLYALSGAAKEAFEPFGLPRNTPVFNPTFTGEGPVRSDDITQDPRYGQMAPHHGMPEGHPPVRSFLAVSVLSRSGEVIGGLFFGHPEVGIFTERTERLVSGVAAQAAIAIDNARLYEAAQSELKERVRVQALLEESQAQLQATFNQAAVGIALADMDGRIVEVNGRFASILGYEPAELIGMKFLDFTHADDVDLSKAKFEELLRGEMDDYCYEKRYVRKDGTLIWSSTTVTLLKDSRGVAQRFMGVIEDITDRKNSEQERKAILESERSARLEAERLGRLKDEFLATLSHELRTPLSAIVGWSHIIKSSQDIPATVQEGINIIDRNARIQTQLVSDLLDMSRIVSGKMRLDVQQVQLPVVILGAIESVRPAADSKGVKIEAILDPISEPAYGDPSRLQQIIWNLVSNAVKFTSKGGKIQVVLQRVNSHVEITVADTGRGISPEFLPHLFERFRQEDASAARSHGGLGIGLALVKNLTDLHGGKIRAASEGLGKGAVFTLELPLAAVHLEAEPSISRFHPRALSSTPTLADLPDFANLDVLLVEDEPDGRDLVRRLLEDCGASVRTCRSADDGLAALSEKEPDVLISDIGMPDKDGYEFIREVRSSGFRTPAAALTAFARSEDRTRALLAGFQVHISKPVEPSELLATIASLAGRTGTSC